MRFVFFSALSLLLFVRARHSAGAPVTPSSVDEVAHKLKGPFRPLKLTQNEHGTLSNYPYDVNPAAHRILVYPPNHPNGWLSLLLKGDVVDGDHGDIEPYGELPLSYDPSLNVLHFTVEDEDEEYGEQTYWLDLDIDAREYSELQLALQSQNRHEKEIVRTNGPTVLQPTSPGRHQPLWMCTLNEHHDGAPYKVSTDWDGLKGGQI